MKKYLLIWLLMTLSLFAATIQTTQQQYTPLEAVSVTVSGMLGDQEDWVGIYPKDATNDWDNVVSWRWTGGIKNGTVTLDTLPDGEYEARAFFKNSFHTEARASFSVKGDLGAAVTTLKEEYKPQESIRVKISHALGNSEDWVGIYPKGATNDWDNVIDWRWTGGIKNGTLTLDGLPAGEYDVRLFFRNSFHTEASHLFDVKAPQPPKPVVYEDGEGALANWIVEEGDQHPVKKTPGFNSAHCVKFPTYWSRRSGTWHNYAEYRLYIKETTNTIFELDVGGVGEKMPHYYVGVLVKTKNGDRRMFWDSWYNHQNAGPERFDYGDTVLLFYPSPIELVRGWDLADVDLWEHFRVDLNEQLHLLEPDNDVVAVTAIDVSGGFLDNITLSPKE